MKEKKQPLGTDTGKVSGDPVHHPAAELRGRGEPLLPAGTREMDPLCVQIESMG